MHFDTLETLQVFENMENATASSFNAFSEE